MGDGREGMLRASGDDPGPPRPFAAPRWGSRVVLVAFAVVILVVSGLIAESYLHGSLLGVGPRVHYCGHDFEAPTVTYDPWTLSQVGLWADPGNPEQVTTSAWLRGRPVFAAVDPATGKIGLGHGPCPYTLWVEVAPNSFVPYARPGGPSG